MVIRKILIANRGEIARRVMHTCRKKGIATAVVYSDADSGATFVQEADEAVNIGSAPASQSYLNIDKIIAAAKLVGADAIHPGYGFLSENAQFAKRCADEGITFIGPSAEAITAMGSKRGAKELLAARAPSVPVIPGYNGPDQRVETLQREALRIGFPVLLKASAGGGGKGMRIVRDASELLGAIDSARTEAANSFGDDTLLVEKYFESVKHIEIQIFGDMHGNVVYLFERECSVQRRHQKVIEEAPSPVMTPQLRAAMGEAAVTIAKLIGYIGAGTVEFIVDARPPPAGRQRPFYFLEVNTRLQVEHPVTEAVTGLDLVELQIEVAQGRALAELGVVQDRLLAIGPRGHAVECRLYAEDPANHFFPCVGQLLLWQPPATACAFSSPAGSPHVRFDTGVVSGSYVSVFYDPMVSKVIAHGTTRDDAIQRLSHALASTAVLGLATNKAFLRTVLHHPKFVDGSFDTHFIDNYLPHDARVAAMAPTKEVLVELGVVATLWDWVHRYDQPNRLLKHVPMGWRNNPHCPQRQLYAIPPLIMGNTAQQDGSAPPSVLRVEYWHDYSYKRRTRNEPYQFRFAVEPCYPNVTSLYSTSSTQFVEVELVSWDSCSLVCSAAGDRVRRHYIVATSPDSETVYVHQDRWVQGELQLKKLSKFFSSSESSTVEHKYTAPMPGKVLRVAVADGDRVIPGQLLVVMESMKMENKIVAMQEGVAKLKVKPGDLVDAGDVLLSLE